MLKFAVPALMLLLAPLGAAAQDTETEPATETPKPPAPGQPVNGAPPPPDVFAARAAASNQFEIRSAELALRRSQQTFVRELAGRLLADHQRAQSELEAAARSQSVPLQVTLDASQTEKLEALAGASEAEFDNAFLSAQMVAHQSAMELFALYAEKGAQGPLKAHAQAQYPTLHMHYLKAHSGAPD